MTAERAIEEIVRMCREAPDRTRVRVMFNNNPWQLLSGAEFLEAWEQPFAGTISVDSAFMVGDDEGRS